MGGVDSAVKDGDTNAFAHGDIPWTVCGTARGAVAVASCLANRPALGGVVVGVGGWRSRSGRWSRRSAGWGAGSVCACVGRDMGAEMKGIGSVDRRIVA